MTSDPIEEIEHTADWALRIRAETLEELFAQAAKGMFALIGQADLDANPIQRPITLGAPDLETLLVTWLEELLYVLETEGLMLSICELRILSDTQLLATIGLQPVKEQLKEIKAVTYHQLDIMQDSEGYQVTIVFDV
jgi:SHS2 domain-containing protein